MISVGRLKQEMQFNKNFGELIEVMKLTATLQFNQFRLKKEPAGDSVHLLEDVFSTLISFKEENDLLVSRPGLPSLFILISSEEGFLGELNFTLANRLLGVKRPEDEVVCVGQQGANYLSDLNLNFSFFDSPGEKFDSEELIKLNAFVAGKYLKRQIGGVFVVYPRFMSITLQQAEVEELLPLSKSFTGKAPIRHLLLEPDIETVIEGWVKNWLAFKFFQIFWSSRLAELAARIMHLEGSFQEMTKINSRLRMEYFKYLHGLSDRSIRELTAARLLKKEN
jgi:F0F1-type ATP synthase gamma subunit